MYLDINFSFYDIRSSLVFALVLVIVLALVLVPVGASTAHRILGFVNISVVFPKTIWIPCIAEAWTAISKKYLILDIQYWEHRTTSCIVSMSWFSRQLLWIERYCDQQLNDSTYATLDDCQLSLNRPLDQFRLQVTMVICLFVVCLSPPMGQI